MPNIPRIRKPSEIIDGFEAIRQERLGTLLTQIAEKLESDFKGFPPNTKS